MHSFLNFIGYYQTKEYCNQFLYHMIGMTILVVVFYLTYYILYLPFTPAIITHAIYIFIMLFSFYLLKKKKYMTVKSVLFFAHTVQLTLAVYLWFPVDTGYNIFYVLIPVAAFVVVDFEHKIEFYIAIVVSALAILLFFISEFIPLHIYICPATTKETNRFLASTSVISTLVPVTFLFARFIYVLNASQKELNIFATTDYLTKVANRRALYEIGENSISKLLSDRRKATESIFSLILIDIDFFKNINDDYGHLVGDEVLKQLAELIIANIRKSDLLARFGGEEFVVFMQGITKQTAENKATQILDAIRHKNFEIDGYQIKITVSMGVTQYEDASMGFKDILRVVDDALYYAKEHGRNQIRVV